ncbi:LpqC [Actinokineospora spheciospongiae]|uniref:LpqC n=1 Tax=Actinokineospora spheciospongiae TaxID=909613 RepID=W7IWF1_9PSEU|nr:hypothetical protein [Actinokineospora spheciospongiae]EWC60791.1 LpqC [Actinokineospora spheciospongiae]
MVVRPSWRPLACLAVAGVAVTALTGSGSGAAEAAPEPVADHVEVTTGGLPSVPAYRVAAPVVDGGVAVLDDIADYGAERVSGRAGLAGGATAAFDLRRGAIGLAGEVTLDDPAAGVRVKAQVSGGVSRVADDTIRWSGLVEITRAGSRNLVLATITVVDRVLDAGNHAVTLRHAGQDRRAVVHVPAGRGGARGLPVLFHFPGLLETPAVAEQYDKLTPHADERGYLLVIPEHYGTGWQGVLGGPPVPDVDDPGFVRALAAEVHERFGGDPRRTYSSGMSNGGFFTSLTACVLTDVFAAFAPVSGQLNDPRGCAPARQIPIAMIHGDADPLVRYSTTVPAAAFWAAHNGCAPEPVATPLPDTDPDDGTTAIRHDYTGCAAGAPVVLFQVVGAGHAWPGGDPYPVPSLGIAGRDLDANETIWDFVSRYTLPVS